MSEVRESLVTFGDIEICCTQDLISFDGDFTVIGYTNSSKEEITEWLGLDVDLGIRYRATYGTHTYGALLREVTMLHYGNPNKVKFEFQTISEIKDRKQEAVSGMDAFNDCPILKGSEMDTEFTKDDLKDGMICTIRDGDEFCSFKGSLFRLHDTIEELSDYQYHLTQKGEPSGDIVKITYGGKIVFERKEKETLEERILDAVDGDLACEIRLIKDNSHGFLCLPNGDLFTSAISCIWFYKFAYKHRNGLIYLSQSTLSTEIDDNDIEKTIQPVAAIFYKD